MLELSSQIIINPFDHANGLQCAIITDFLQAKKKINTYVSVRKIYFVHKSISTKIVILLCVYREPSTPQSAL